MSNVEITTPPNKSLTTHNLKTLRQHTTITITSTFILPPLCTPPKPSPLPTTQNQPSITTTVLEPSHLNFRYRAYFEQGVPWHSGKYRVWVHSETRTWHDKNMQPSTNTSKLKTTPSKHTISSCEHLPFTFYFIPNRSNYISKLNLSMNLARLGTETQRNT